LINYVNLENKEKIRRTKKRKPRKDKKCHGPEVKYGDGAMVYFLPVDIYILKDGFFHPFVFGVGVCGQNT